jgi:hypothetical protein
LSPLRWFSPNKHAARGRSGVFFEQIRLVGEAFDLIDVLADLLHGRVGGSRVVRVLSVSAGDRCLFCDAQRCGRLLKEGRGAAPLGD